MEIDSNIQLSCFCCVWKRVCKKSLRTSLHFVSWFVLHPHHTWQSHGVYTASSSDQITQNCLLKYIRFTFWLFCELSKFPLKFAWHLMETQLKSSNVAQLYITAMLVFVGLNTQTCRTDQNMLLLILSTTDAFAAMRRAFLCPPWPFLIYTHLFSNVFWPLL